MQVALMDEGSTWLVFEGKEKRGRVVWLKRVSDMREMRRV